MRRAIFDNNFIVNEQNECYGINLGFDYAAEHEWGIKTLQQHFALQNEKSFFMIKKPILGVESRKINQVDPTCLFWEKTPDYACLIFSSSIAYYATKSDLQQEYYKNIYKRCLQFYKDKQITTAWNEKSFGIKVKGDNNIVKLESLYKALLACDMIISLGAPSFGRGLCLFQLSKIPENIKQSFYDMDLNQYKIKKAASATKIEQLLKRKNCDLYTIRPEWTKNIKNVSPTEYPVVFWINPTKQLKYKRGWFTVEELKLWSRGQGPVIK